MFRKRKALTHPLPPMTSAPEASDLLACRATEEEEEAFLAATRAEVSIMVREMGDADAREGGGRRKDRD